MLSFNIVNLILGLLIGSLVGLICYFFTKQKPIIISLAIVAALGSFGLGKLLLEDRYAVWSLTSQINDIPIMSAIKEYHPRLYEGIVNNVRSTVEAKDSTNNPLSSAYLTVNKIFLADLKSASNKVIRDYLVNLKRLYDYFYQTSPAYIVKMEHADLSILIDLRYLSSNQEFTTLFKQAIEAKKNVIKEAVQNPVAPPPINVAKPMLDALLASLKTQYGDAAVDAAFGQNTANQVTPDTQAKVILTFYQQLLNMNANDAGTIMRYIGLTSEAGG